MSRRRGRDWRPSRWATPHPPRRSHRPPLPPRPASPICLRGSSPVWGGGRLSFSICSVFPSPAFRFSSTSGRPALLPASCEWPRSPCAFSLGSSSSPSPAMNEEYDVIVLGTGLTVSCWPGGCAGRPASLGEPGSVPPGRAVPAAAYSARVGAAGGLGPLDCRLRLLGGVFAVRNGFFGNGFDEGVSRNPRAPGWRGSLTSVQGGPRKWRPRSRRWRSRSSGC